MPFYYYFDWSYLVLVVPALLFSLWASARVNSTFKKYSAMRNARGMTGAEAARAVLNANGVTDVRIEYVSGNLTDHYDPKNKSFGFRRTSMTLRRLRRWAWRRTRRVTRRSTPRTICPSASARPSFRLPISARSCPFR